MRIDLSDEDRNRIVNIRSYLNKHRPSELEGIKLTNETVIKYSILTTSDLVETVKLVDKLGKERDKITMGKMKKVHKDLYYAKVQKYTEQLIALRDRMTKYMSTNVPVDADGNTYVLSHDVNGNPAWTSTDVFSADLTDKDYAHYVDSYIYDI